MKTIDHLKNLQVIEFRRYTLKEGKREQFAKYFDTYFPEAFEQMGALVVGQFYERDKPLGFTWMRAFHTLDDRPKVNAEFYYGPLWREHAGTLNGLMTDSDNVLLLRPLTSERSPLVLPAVDPVTENDGAHGVVVAQIFTLKQGATEAFARQAEPIFAKYRESGAREAGVLVTLDVNNNFPQLPIRTDGPYLVWLGVFQNDEALQSKFDPLARNSLPKFAATGLLRSEPELVILDPTHRSRLRWLDEKKK